MSNLKIAQDALQAELTLARQGLAYYTERVGSLQAAIEQLTDVLGAADGDVRATNKGKRGKTAGDAVQAPKKAAAQDAKKEKAGTRGKKTRRAASGGRSASNTDLPKTGAEFWLAHIDAAPKAAHEIADAAAAALGLQTDKDKDTIRALKGRVGPALAAMVKAQAIQADGAGRERRFFRGA